MGVSALFTAVFLACIVEAVAAITIVLAAGTARDRRSAMQGLAAGTVDLDSTVTGHFGLDHVDAALRSTTQPETLTSVVDPRN